MPSEEREQVLVIPRKLFDQVGAFEGFRAEGVEEAMQTLLDPSSHFFMDRQEAEEDPSHKQLIPYCVFRCGDRVLHYTRGKVGGESRLHAKISVGVGGHINPVDMEDGKKGPEAYHAAVSREIDEELHLAESPPHRIIGMINDDSNPVGQVHLGIVHLVDLAGDQVFSAEDALTDLQFSKLMRLQGEMYDRLETWSQFCIDALGSVQIDAEFSANVSWRYLQSSRKRAQDLPRNPS